MRRVLDLGRHRVYYVSGAVWRLTGPRNDLSRNPDDSRLRGGVAVRLDCDNVDAPARNPSELLARPGQSHEWVAKIRVYVNQSVGVAGRGGPGKHWSA